MEDEIGGSVGTHPSILYPTRNKISSSPPNNLLRLRPNGISHSSSCSALIVWGSPRYIFLLLPPLSLHNSLSSCHCLAHRPKQFVPKNLPYAKGIDHSSKLSLGAAAVLHSSSHRDHDHALHQSLILESGPTPQIPHSALQ